MNNKKELVKQYEEASDYLWTFVNTVDEHSAYMQQYKNDYKSLMDKLDDYLDAILKLHCKVFKIDDYQNIYTDNISVCCNNYYDDPIFPVPFVEIFSYLIKEKFDNVDLKDFCLVLFGEEFEHITDGKQKESIYMSEEYRSALNSAREQVEKSLEDENAK